MAEHNMNTSIDVKRQRRCNWAGIAIRPLEYIGYIQLYYWIYPEITMGSSQKRAIQNYRTRLGKRGLARFEVLGRDADRDLIRNLARRLAEDGPEASRLRTAVRRTIAGEPPKQGVILAALRRSPLVNADLNLTRPREEGRDIEL
jgi:hypothetical protein